MVQRFFYGRTNDSKKIHQLKNIHYIQHASNSSIPNFIINLIAGIPAYRLIKDFLKIKYITDLQ